MPPRSDPSRLHRIEVTTQAAERDVFRFVHAVERGDPKLHEDFISDRAAGKHPKGRSVRLPELQDGMSAFRTLKLARRRWSDIAALAARRGQPVRIGEAVARVRLIADKGFAYEDLGLDDGHLTIWGDAQTLAAAVIRIVSARE